ncbi:hypothetical protein MPSEU_000460800 [Mayamaea pseudoterrestris]|nr:hypothetical protein MPSEU_000460800 [Mayamaea pseudoterrestris]
MTIRYDNHDHNATNVPSFGNPTFQVKRFMACMSFIRQELAQAGMEPSQEQVMQLAMAMMMMHRQVTLKELLRQYNKQAHANTTANSWLAQVRYARNKALVALETGMMHALAMRLVAGLFMMIHHGVAGAMLKVLQSVMAEQCSNDAWLASLLRELTAPTAAASTEEATWLHTFWNASAHLVHQVRTILAGSQANERYWTELSNGAVAVTRVIPNAPCYFAHFAWYLVMLLFTWKALAWTSNAPKARMLLLSYYVVTFAGLSATTLGAWMLGEIAMALRVACLYRTFVARHRENAPTAQELSRVKIDMEEAMNGGLALSLLVVGYAIYQDYTMD